MCTFGSIHFVLPGWGQYLKKISLRTPPGRVLEPSGRKTGEGVYHGYKNIFRSLNQREYWRRIPAQEDGINGGICNVVYYNTALTMEKISNIYNSVKMLNPPILLNYYIPEFI